MQTLGPFYPSSLVNVANGGAPWTISGGQATASVPSDNVTDFLQATGFGADIPSDKTIVEIRLQLPSLHQGSELFNNSDQFIVGSILGDQQAWVAPPLIRVESDSTPGLTPAVANDPAFGFKFAIYSTSGGPFVVDTLALYIDVE